MDYLEDADCYYYLCKIKTQCFICEKVKKLSLDMKAGKHIYMEFLKTGKRKLPLYDYLIVIATASYIKTFS